jgi:hypothetical protein
MPQPKGVLTKKRSKVDARRRKRRKWRLQEQQRQAGRHLRAIERAVADLGLEQALSRVLERKLKASHRLMSKIFGVMFPVLFGCESYPELCRVMGWDKNLPGRLLGSMPKRKWIEKLRALGQDVLEALGQRVQDMSEATRSRWQWTWVLDSTVFRKYGEKFGLVKPVFSNQDKRKGPGIEVVLLAVVVGDGKLVVPLDFEIRRPDPAGAGHPCLDKLQWTSRMLDRNLEAFEQRGLQLPAPLVAADAWFADSQLMKHLRERWNGTLLVEGKKNFVFELDEQRRLDAKTLLQGPGPRRTSGQLPDDVRYRRLHAQSKTFGSVILTIVDEPKEKELYYLLCLSTDISSTRLWRAFARRNWIEWCFRTLKTLLKTDKCQFGTEEAYYGHVAMRLMALLVLGYATRRVLRGRASIEQAIFGIKHHWRMLDSEFIEFETLSSEQTLKQA